MNIHFAITQLIRRPGRTSAAIISIALGIMLFSSLQTYADGYREAARAPLISDRFEGLLYWFHRWAARLGVGWLPAGQHLLNRP